MQIDGDDLLSHEVQRHLTNNNNTEIERGLVLPRPSHGLVRAGMPPSRRKEKVSRRIQHEKQNAKIQSANYTRKKAHDENALS